MEELEQNAVTIGSISYEEVQTKVAAKRQELALEKRKESRIRRGLRYVGDMQKKLISRRARRIFQIEVLLQLGWLHSLQSMTSRVAMMLYRNTLAEYFEARARTRKRDAEIRRLFGRPQSDQARYEISDLSQHWPIKFSKSPQPLQVELTSSLA